MDDSRKNILFGVTIAILALVAGWTLHVQYPELLGGIGGINEIREGTYDLFGSNPGSDTVDYQGTVFIKRSGDIYDLQWNFPGGQLQRGVGILDRGVLSVGYIDMSEGSVSEAGAVSYTVDSREKLRGTWVSILGGTQGTETLWWRGE